MTPVIETDGLSKWFGEVVAVNNLSVALEPGVTGLLGPNGAGKSTFIRLVLGLYHPSRGTVKVFGETPRNNLDVLRRLSFCPESDHFFEGATGYSFVYWTNRYSGMATRDARIKAIEACERVGMAHRMHDRITSYSKGMRQRIKIAQAVAVKPDLLVLDEPMQGLDPEAREATFRLIRELGDEGLSVLVSSHILYEIERVTNTVLLLHNGTVLAHGSVGHIRALIDEHPHAVTLEGEDLRPVAAHFANQEHILAIEFVSGGVEIRTNDPNRFYQELNEFILEKNLDVAGIRCADDNLQAVFSYLVH